MRSAGRSSRIGHATFVTIPKAMKSIPRCGQVFNSHREASWIPNSSKTADHTIWFFAGIS